MDNEIDELKVKDEMTLTKRGKHGGDWFGKWGWQKEEFVSKRRWSTAICSF